MSLSDRVKWSVVLFISVILAFYYGRESFNLLLTSFFVVGILEWTLLCDKMPVITTEEKTYTNYRIRLSGYISLVIFWLCSHWLYVRNKKILFQTLLHVFASDIGGYIGGNVMPRSYKLWPSISPSKTIAGCIVSVFCSAIGTFITKASFNFGIVVSLTAQIGDLLESKAKRIAEVKDSNLEIIKIPGHGGVLDRLDGIILTVPVVCALQLLAK